MSENFAEMFEQSITQMNMRVGEIITGEVVDINRDVVIVNAGLKSEGVIPREQFYNEGGELEVAIGDIVAAVSEFPAGGHFCDLRADWFNQPRHKCVGVVCRCWCGWFGHWVRGTGVGA